MLCISVTVAITMAIFHSRRVRVPRTRRGDIIRKNEREREKKKVDGRSYLQLFANS